ncbi:LysM peptidoglycan-binding domain-containing protein [Hymenobacter taeanensis]|uniref:LysM peptidoglycan-binding domain-containing protein n=1 Tax=Hymenobacter taeanensis TaxID=2735321 RepID=A0A6M6BCJ3_9BACT|nr:MULTISPECIES: LysM peptidoglycan-binding domain-containing protein [Hymenobacter]QJX45917.1 LysM peptidoglycan-binding domain-containing protein [Hymenobacter taeanensis]UOQ79763.1 LysM peptidoglycan-binding domain-containing protein [Hymenobacter sp. 5414T-23]
MRFLFSAQLFAGLLLGSLTAHAQKAPALPPLSEDSVRVMSGLVQTSVRQLRGIYFEPNDAQATQLIETALQDIPALNQRLSHYTTSLSPAQQQALAKRLRQQPWQVELRTLLRSPQFRGFDARAAKNPALQAAATRLKATGFVGSPLPAPAPAPPVAATASPAAPTMGLMPTAPKDAAPKPAQEAHNQHTVQKGETLFSIAKHYGVSTTQLQQWNGKSNTGVRIGEVLLLEAATK